MSNEVWVKWRGPSTGTTWFVDTVDELKDDAQIKDLRKAFVKQQNLLQISPGGVEVRETENGDMLKVDTTLTNYFVPPAGSAALPGPGNNADNPLFLYLPQQQQKTQGKSRFISLSCFQICSWFVRLLLNLFESSSANN